MAFDQSKWVWKNGELVPWESATLHVSAHGLHYGTGVFEGVRCYETDDGPAIFRMKDHVERLYASALTHGMEIPLSQMEMEAAICETIRRNGFRSCYVRPICFFGSGNLSVHPRDCPVEIAILAWPWGAYLGAQGLDRGVRITVSPWQKFRPSMMPTAAKACGQYINSALAMRDAISRGYDEAILLNTSGHIAEGAGENLFVIRDKKLATNDECDSILPGITRNSVIALARDLGYEVEVRPLPVEDLLDCDEAFFTGTAVEVTPIRELDGRSVGGGKRGPITTRLQKKFSEVTSGREPGYKDWLHFVDQ